MCFNLFGPLVDDLELATCLIQTLLPNEIHNVSNVLLEYAPEPARDYLMTAQLLMLSSTMSIHLASLDLWVSKTKLTEAFSPKVYRSPFYNRWLDNPKAPWSVDAHSQLQAIEVNPIMARSFTGSCFEAFT